MSTYREALFHARSGGTARLGDKIVRFLNREEAEPILLEQRPERRYVRGSHVVETLAPPNYNLKKLGLYDVGQNPPVEFRPTEEEIMADWETAGPS